MVRYLSALFSAAPPSQPATRPADPARDGDDFLKLDNDVSISREKIEIGTVLYDRRSSPERARSWLTRLFSFIKEWRAVRWVETFVSKRLAHLPGSAEFVRNIRRQGGVRRDDFLDFLLEQRLTGQRATWLGAVAHERSGDHQIANVGSAIQGRVLSALGSVPTVQLDAFLVFIDSGCLDVPHDSRQHAEAFVSHFRSFAAAHPTHPLRTVMQGKVNLLARHLEEDKKFFEDCRAFKENLQKLGIGVTGRQSKISGWFDFDLAVDAGAEGMTECHELTKGLQPLEYADSYFHMAEQGDPVTRGDRWPDQSWSSLVETMYRRYTYRESRRGLAERWHRINFALARLASDAATVSDNDSAKALEAFFAYCHRGPATISQHSIRLLRTVTEETVRIFCHQTFGEHEEGEDVAIWADNLFIRLAQDLATFEDSSAISSSSQEILD